MTDDRELLELAALAGGIELEYENGAPCKVELEGTYRKRTWWDPRNRSGDALDLAVKLKITPHIDGNLTDCEGCTEAHLEDPYAATRLAITRAAAEIGRQMRGEQHE